MVPPATDEKYTGLRCGRYFCPKSRSVSTDARMRCSIWLLMVITADYVVFDCGQGLVLALALPVALHLQPLPFTHLRLQPVIDGDVDQFQLGWIVAPPMVPVPGLQQVEGFRLGEPCPAHGRRQFVQDFGSGFVFEVAGVPRRPKCFVTIEAAELVRWYRWRSSSDSIRVDVIVFCSGAMINSISKHCPFQSRRYLPKSAALFVLSSRAVAPRQELIPVFDGDAVLASHSPGPQLFVTNPSPYGFGTHLVSLRQFTDGVPVYLKVS